MVKVLFVFLDLLNDPGKGGAERLVQHRSAGFADGFQTTEGPFARTILPQLTHEQGVRQHDQVHVPGLAQAIAKLTVSHAKLLLTVPMIGLLARWSPGRSSLRFSGGIDAANSSTRHIFPFHSTLRLNLRSPT